MRNKAAAWQVSFIPQLLATVIVHPTQKQVIPLAPEPIERQVGTNQNIGELKAIERFLAELRREHPQLKFIVLLDGYYPRTSDRTVAGFQSGLSHGSQPHKTHSMIRKTESKFRSQQHEIIEEQYIRPQ